LDSTAFAKKKKKKACEDGFDGKKKKIGLTCLSVKHPIVARRTGPFKVSIWDT